MPPLDGLSWITIGLGAASGLAGLVWAYHAYGVEALVRSIRFRLHLNRLLGRRSTRDPAVEVQQALNDALRDPPLDAADPNDLSVSEAPAARR